MAKRAHDDDDDWIDEGDDAHDEADQKRFSSDTAFCPECGAEILDDADICPKCFTWIDGATHRRPSAFRRSFRTIVIVLVVIGMLLGCAGLIFVLRTLGSN